jgi:hypothetical protein
MRALLSIGGVLSVLYAAWWLPLIFMVILSVRWRAWEVPVLGLLIDFLWLPSTGYFLPVPWFTIAGILISWVFEPLRKQFLLN